MALKFSKLAIAVVIIVLLPATLILTVISPIGATGVLLVLMFWVLIPVVIAKIYWQFKKTEDS